MDCDVLSLIHNYRIEMESIEEIIKSMREFYEEYVDVDFRTISDVEYFICVLSTRVESNVIRLENRCDTCHPGTNYGTWTYVDESELSIRKLVDFIIYLKTSGRLCVHERLEGVDSSNFVCILKLNVRAYEEIPNS